MSFLKSRIAIESIEESQEETSEDQVNDNPEDNEPVSNDDNVGESGDNSDDEPSDDQNNAGDDGGDGASDNNDDAATGDDGDATDDNTQEIDEEAEQARVEGEEAEADLDTEEQLATESLELCGELNTVISVATALESVSEFIYASMKTGAYTPTTSTFVNEQVSHHLARLNQKATAMVAMEADADPAQQSGVATQNRGTIRAMIDRLIEIAKNAFDSVMDYVKERTARITSVAGRTKVRAMSLLKHLEKKETTMRSLNSPRMAAAIGINGVVGDLGNALDTATGYVDHFMSPTAYNHIKNIMQSATTKDDKSVTEMGKSLKALSDSWLSKLPKQLLEEKTWHTSDLLPGNYVFAASVPETIEELQNLKTTVKQVPFKSESKGVIEAITIDEAKVLVKKLLRGIFNIEKIRGDAGVREVEKGYSKLISDAKRIDDKANASVLRSAFNAVIRLITSSASAPSITFTAGWMRIAANYLDYLSSASSFGFVNVAVNATGDKYNQVAGAAGAAYDKNLKPHVDRAGAAVKPYTDRASAAVKPYTDGIASGVNTAKNKASSGFNAARDKASSGINSVRSRFGGDKTASA